jgi:hypothetical protein
MANVLGLSERPGGEAPKIGQPIGRVGASRSLRWEPDVRAVRPNLMVISGPALDDGLASTRQGILFVQKLIPKPDCKLCTNPFCSDLPGAI